MLYKPVMQGLARSALPKGEVKEAFPLPLDFLGFLEGLLIRNTEPLCVLLLAGAALAAVWGELTVLGF